MKITAIIPARFASTRFPGKALADIMGKPMIQHVYEQTCRAAHVGEVVVATDDERIAATVRSFGGRAEMTATNHETGTDRLAEVAARLDCDPGTRSEVPRLSTTSACARPQTPSSARRGRQRIHISSDTSLLSTAAD